MHPLVLKSLLYSAALLLTLTAGSTAYAGVPSKSDVQLAPESTSSCPTSGIVAFSVRGSHHFSSGGSTLLGYTTIYSNVNAGWVSGGGTFIAPCTGLYVFAVSFTKDSYSGGTKDDVFVNIYHNGVDKGYAWSGEDAYQNRNTGAYTVTLFMNAGGTVQTFVSSDSGVYRHLAIYDFTGFLVKAL